MRIQSLVSSSLLLTPLTMLPLAFSLSCSDSISDANKGSDAPQPTQESIAADAAAQLVVTDVVAGTGAEAVSGKTIYVNYVGTFLNGTQFDSSFDHNGPFAFVLGNGQVIKGWDEGLIGMKVGGKRKLSVPSRFGYGTAGAGSTIPPNTTLLFNVELVDVK